MHDDTPSSHEQGPDTVQSGTTATDRGRSPMRARTWTIAAQYAEPADYGIPELPAWRVCLTGCDALAFADADADPFIAAENPTTVRR